MSAEPKIRSRPDKIFISIDESTARSTLSFAPADAGEPFQYDDDKSGTRAMKDAQTILGKYPGCTISGPHFHAARPPRARPRPRKPA